MDSMNNPLTELSPCVRIFIESLLTEAGSIDSGRPANLDLSNHDSSKHDSSDQRSSNPRARRNVLASECRSSRLASPLTAVFAFQPKSEAPA